MAFDTRNDDKHTVDALQDWTITGAAAEPAQSEAPVQSVRNRPSLADLLPAFSQIEDETVKSDVDEILAEINALDPQLQQAVTELFDEHGEIRDNCLTLESLQALSADGALDNSPKLQAYFENYFRQAYGSAEDFEAEITDYLNNQDPENATDMLIFMARFGDPAELDNVKKIAQKAYEDMLIKGRTDPRYAFEAELLRQNLPFELDERNDLKNRQNRQHIAREEESLDGVEPPPA